MIVVYYPSKELPPRLGGCVIAHGSTQFRLVNGQNDIPDADWAILKGSSTVAEYLESGLIEVAEPKPAPKAPAK